MKTHTKTISVQIEVNQDGTFKSDEELLQWIALCLNRNTNYREVTVTVEGASYGPEVKAATAIGA